MGAWFNTTAIIWSGNHKVGDRMERRMALRFEDLRVYQQARSLTNSVYKLTRQGAFAKDYGLRDQVRRASVSIASNIAEGYERGGKTESFSLCIWQKDHAAKCAHSFK